MAWFRRRDHLGDPRQPLDESVRRLVHERLGSRPEGPVRLLTHLRYFGHCMNPVSFYYCFDASGRTVEATVAEVHNTPWNERHCYVLGAGHADPRGRRYRFDKVFHVSPFMSMEQTYEMRIGDPAPRLLVHMENHEGGRQLFDATMVLEERAMTAAQRRRVLIRHPFMTPKVLAAIYWQALRLRLKGCPFHPHPKHEAPAA
jgi:DUF1365 family protein